MAFTVHQGWETECGIAKETTPGDGVAPSIGYEVESVRLSPGVNHEEFPGMMGSHVEHKHHDVVTTLAPSASFTIPVRAENISLLLELLTGDPSSPYTPAATASSFSLYADIGPKQPKQLGSKISAITFSASQDSQILRAAVECLGMSHDASPAAGAETIPTPANTDPPFLFRGATFEADDTPFYASSVEIAIRRALIDDVFRNSQTRLEIPEGIVTAEIRLTVDYNSDYYTALYALALAGTWFKLEALFDNGVAAPANDDLDFAFDNVKVYEPDTLPEPGRDNAITVDLACRAKASTIGGVDLFTITETTS